MGRASAILQSEYPYNISARCINREWFNLPMPEVWDIFCSQLSETIASYDLEVHSFVLMSNHFHLIASTPKANISACMHNFMTKTSRKLNKRGNRLNGNFAGRHYKCILQENRYFLSAYKYNYINPVTAGICTRVEEYPYSTLRFLLSPKESKFELIPDETYSSDPSGTLEWLNEPPSPEQLEAVRYALKRSYFKSKKSRSTNKPLLKDDDIL